MEQNKIEEQEPVKDDEKMALKGRIGLWSTIAGILFIAGWIGYAIHPPATVQKVFDTADAERHYQKGYNDGIRFGERRERAEWCKPQ